MATPEIARRLRDKGPETTSVTFSLGWAVRENEESLEDSIRRADYMLIEERRKRRHTDSRASDVPE